MQGVGVSILAASRQRRSVGSRRTCQWCNAWTCDVPSSCQSEILRIVSEHRVRSDRGLRIGTETSPVGGVQQNHVAALFHKPLPVSRRSGRPGREILSSDLTLAEDSGRSNSLDAFASTSWSVREGFSFVFGCSAPHAMVLAGGQCVVQAFVAHRARSADELGGVFTSCALPTSFVIGREERSRPEESACGSVPPVLRCCGRRPRGVDAVV